MKLVTAEKETNEDEENPVNYLATGKIDAPNGHVIRSYGIRWRIETFLKDSRQDFGFGDCEMQTNGGARRFPPTVAVCYHERDRDKSGEVIRGYAACGITDRSAKQVERFCRKLSSTETSYRLLRQARRFTTTQNPVVRFAIVLVAALLENLWLVLR